MALLPGAHEFACLGPQVRHIVAVVPLINLFSQLGGNFGLFMVVENGLSPQPDANLCLRYLPAVRASAIKLLTGEIFVARPAVSENTAKHFSCNPHHRHLSCAASIADQEVR